MEEGDAIVTKKCDHMCDADMGRASGHQASGGSHDGIMHEELHGKG
jgi:hypothetical protein